MIKGFGNAAMGVVFAALLDKYFCAGHYMDAALAMLRQIRHSSGF